MSNSFTNLEAKGFVKLDLQKKKISKLINNKNWKADFVPHPTRWYIYGRFGHRWSTTQAEDDYVWTFTEK